MINVTFIDTEVSTETNRILDYGGVKTSGEWMHDQSLPAFMKFIAGSSYLCGHNVIHFDLSFIYRTLGESQYHSLISNTRVIDTLYLSALLFPKRPYHALVKNEKLQTEELNNPLSDAKKAMDLFYDEVEAFRKKPEVIKRIFYGLLHTAQEFCAFFQYMDYRIQYYDLENEIRELFGSRICINANLGQMIRKTPIELAYCLALIDVDDEYSITPPWILKRFPMVEQVMHQLRNTPCLMGCSYCSEQLNAKSGLKRFFGYDAYRDFDGVPLQEQAVNAALHNKSLLAVFPTGGGKSITFQVPALMSGKNTKGLTVIISPLQSLMKDQVDNLERIGITDAVTINGLLDPIERAESMRRVREGEATLLYISPESLRSRTIEHMLLDRKINRFVIDEAHCFSAWGQDFRVDYLYIAEFMKQLCEKKQLSEMIPISCFTATAKQNVIDDIKKYFHDNLQLDLELYAASSARKNLTYKVIEKKEAEKYEQLRLLLEYRKSPTIIYVSRTSTAEKLAGHLVQDGYEARAYHGKMDKKEKSANQDAFIRGEINIMVATSAFGMGVDKKNVGMVIHYDISDSLENYVQEAGRAGRDQAIQAECFVLFNDEDLNKHFMLLNQTKISISEIQQIWKAIKESTRFRSKVSNSALELARKAGWDDNVRDLETRVTTAIAALEDAGYIKRGQNVPHVYADSILAKSLMEAGDKIRSSHLFAQKEEEEANRIMNMMISARSRKSNQNDIAESRVDWIADNLGISKEEVISIISKLRQAHILADAKDLSIYVDEHNSMGKSMGVLHRYHELEEFLYQQIPDEMIVLNMKELNELAQEQGLKKVNTDQMKTVLNFWSIKGMITKETSRYTKNLLKVQWKYNKSDIYQRMVKRWDIAEICLEYLEDINTDHNSVVQFSVLELLNNYNYQRQLLSMTAQTSEIEEALFYLSRIDAIKIEGGFLVSYNALNIERLVKDNKVRYKVEDYKKLKTYYEQKTQMIHIVGEYAKKLLSDYASALTFVDDYFQLEYSSFLNKYFKDTRAEEIQRNLTPEKFQQLFGELSVAQLNIIKDHESQYIVVGAGPGSGKTRILVHKLSSLLLLEDVKSEQLLMLTFSRAAATEFKKRLIKMIGTAANFVDIKTFHSYCFDLLGRVGNIEKSLNVVKEAAVSIENGEVEASHIAKTVLVIDEAQDMDEHEYHLIQALIAKNDDMRVIAVGDDDQNIYAFRGSDSIYMQRLLQHSSSKLYELVENYRSKPSLVEFTNYFIEPLEGRMKHTPIMAVAKDEGKLRIVHYQSSNLVVPVVNSVIQTGVKGSTCILTKTNEEALQVQALLQEEHIRCKLIQGSDKFDLYNLKELRFFMKELHLKPETYMIDDDIWKNAKQQLKMEFKTSDNLTMCERLIYDFEVTNRVKYVSDWMAFVHESHEEDFYDHNDSSLVIGTIHKSKGWEFDHVILMLNNFQIHTKEERRLLYVGMTRAKSELTIHYNGQYLEQRFDPVGMLSRITCFHNKLTYPEPNRIRKQLGYYDVYLSYYYKCEKAVAVLNSGDELILDREGCKDKRGQRVLLFSSRFKEEISKQERKGYHLEKARVHQIFYWHEESREDETMVVLPIIEMIKETKQ